MTEFMADAVIAGTSAAVTVEEMEGTEPAADAEAPVAEAVAEADAEQTSRRTARLSAAPF